MAKKNRRDKGKEDLTQKYHKKYTGPFQTNPYAKIDAAKHIMEISGHSPTQDTFSPLSESDNYFPSEDELSNQVLAERSSPTERRKLILKIGLYVMWIIVGAGTIGAIGLFYSHDLRLSKSESSIDDLKEDVKGNSKDINEMKTDKKLFEYQLKELKENKGKN